MQKGALHPPRSYDHQVVNPAAQRKIGSVVGKRKWKSRKRGTTGRFLWQEKEIEGTACQNPTELTTHVEFEWHSPPNNFKK